MTARLLVARCILAVGAVVALAGVGVCVCVVATLLHPEAMEL